MRTACAYIRVSDERQDEYSPDSQKKRIFAYAAQHELQLSPEAVFYDDGISAKTAENRTAFQQMIAAAKTNPRPFDVILVWKFSRFARNQEEAIVYKNLLRKIGVEVISVSEPLTDDPFGTLIERIIEWMDEYYLINLSSEVRRGMTEKATRGEAMGRAVFGYDRKGKTYIPNGDAELVRQLFHRFSEGQSIGQLRDDLLDRGVRTVCGNSPDARWLRYLLQNPVYAGKICWSTRGRRAQAHPESVIQVQGSHPPLVSEELFDQVQRRLQALKSTPHPPVTGGAPWLLQGMMYCSACGARLVKAGSKTPSVQCSRYAKGKCNVSHALSLNKAEKCLFQALDPVLHLQIHTSDPDDASQIACQKQIQRAETRLRRAAEAYRSGIDTLEEYRTIKQTIQAEIKMLEQKLHSPAQTTNGSLGDLLQSVKLDVGTKNHLLQQVIDRIVYVKKEGRLEIILKQPESVQPFASADKSP